MEKLMKRVKTELDNIAEKGLTSSNLETTNKLVDIYKDLTEICKKEIEGGENDMYNARNRDRDGRYRDRDWDWDRYDNRGRGNYGHYPLDDRTERYFDRMRDGMETYDAGRSRYRDGGSNERMVEGIEMTMAAIIKFVEYLVDNAETSQEKELVRKYVDKLKNV